MTRSIKKAGPLGPELPDEASSKRRGAELRRLRTTITDETVEELAYGAGINGRTIRDNWENRGGPADWAPFWAYMKILEKKAEAQDQVAEFVRLRDEVVQLFFPEIPKQRPGDPRTPEEYHQDLADFVREQEIGRTGKLRDVAALVERLGASSKVPKPVLPSHEIEAATSWEVLPNKAFDIRLVFPIENRTISIHRRSPGTWRSPYLLSIDLRDQRYGIYSGAGKNLLIENFVAGASGRALYGASERIDKFMAEITEDRGDLSWKELVEGHLAPLRHASAGILPMARRLRPGSGGQWEDDGDWVALFLRDIPPVGLNVGNGASEDAREYRNLEELISREFAEELILLKHRPKPGQQVQQFIFFDHGGGRALTDSKTFKRFLDAHKQLRKQHDDFDIEISSERRFLTPLSTPFAVRVMDSDGHSRCGNVIFSVNPPELGIEVIRPYRFDLHDGEWLLDGEILPSSQAEHKRLVRRPIVLIRMDFLREQFHKKLGLGEIIESPIFLGGKRLNEIPADAFRIFVEFDSRKSRLAYIEERLGSEISEVEKRALDSERKLIKEWQSKYENTLCDAQDGKPLKGDLVTTFCPVSYKTIEAGFRHHVVGF